MHYDFLDGDWLLLLLFREFLDYDFYEVLVTVVLLSAGVLYVVSC